MESEFCYPFPLFFFYKKGFYLYFYLKNFYITLTLALFYQSYYICSTVILASLRLVWEKKNRNLYMTKWQKRGLMFNSVPFPRNVITCSVCLLFKRPFLHKLNLPLRLPDLYGFWVKWTIFNRFIMADLRWRMVSFPFIMTSLLLLKIIYVLANFLISSDTSYLSIFRFMALYFKGNLDSANKFNNMTS